MRQGSMKRMPDQERQNILSGLKTNWEILHHQFQGLRLVTKSKVGYVFPIIVVSILHQAEFGRSDHRKYTPHFNFKIVKTKYHFNL